MKKINVYDSDLEPTESREEQIKNNSPKKVAAAKNCLDKAHCQECEKKKQGYKYMTLDKTSKYVHPDNFEKYLGEGWRFS